MSAKSANVTARIEPETKAQAEAIIAQLGIPVSVVINSLYRQIIMRNGIPFPLTVPSAPKAREDMTEEEFDGMMAKGLEDAKAGRGVSLEEAFDRLYQGIE